MPGQNYTSTHTGLQINTAVGKALNLDDFEYINDETIDGKVFHIFWKIKPTNSNTTQGFSIHPQSGKIYMIMSVNGTRSIYKYLSEKDTLENSDIDALFNNSN